MHQALSASHKSTVKKLCCLSATVLTAMLGFSLGVDRQLAFRPSREVRELRPAENTLTLDYYSRGDQSNQRATEVDITNLCSRTPSCSVRNPRPLYFPLLLPHYSVCNSRRRRPPQRPVKRCFFFTKLKTRRPLQPLGQNLSSQNRPTISLPRLDPQSLSDDARTRSRTTRQILFQAAYHSLSLFCYSPGTAVEY